MTRDRLKRIYDLHAWVGVVCGLFVYVVSLSGVLALFGEELHLWEDPDLRIALPEEPVPVMPLMRGFLEELGPAPALVGLSLRLPRAVHPFYEATARVWDQESRSTEVHWRRWHPASGRLLPDRGEGVAHWLVDLHRHLLLPRSLGRPVVGLAGLLLLLSVVSGAVIHRKLLSEAFVWRLDRSVRLKWQDSHKAIGLWGLPFHLMIAFTGAWLGFVALLLPLTAAVSFKGDQGAVIAAVLGTPPQPAGVASPMVSLDRARRAVEARTGAPAELVEIVNWGDAAGRYRFFFPPPAHLKRYAQIDVAAADGTLSEPVLGEREGFAHRLLPAMTTLHYGTFGGPWLKLLYSLLGLALCLVTVTGTMMWLERRLHGNAGGASPTTYRVLSRVTIGVSVGLALASIAVFYADRLLPVAAGARGGAIGLAFFGVWAAALGYALVRRNGYRSCKELLAATAAACLALPLLDLASGGDAPWAPWAGGRAYALGTNLTAFVVGLVLLLASRRLPDRRPQGKRPAAAAAERAAL